MSHGFEAVEQFEEALAEWCGSAHAVAVESCSAALLLCCEHIGVEEVTIPKRTYPSVPAAIIHAGGTVKFGREWWSGTYRLEPYNITDAALRFRKGMYEGGLMCLSFHAKKHLAIGRGGMVLTDSCVAAKWLRYMRFDGRAAEPLGGKLHCLGWNAYMTPEQAARGLQLFDTIKDKALPDLDVKKQDYPDLSKYRRLLY
jgi:dTDP-4-amino-4,6-dideoxygalactose transaminase